ncbi:MAG: hypothetical protein JWM12_4016 [Ilumatobacteraceae bacterium]|nr:hypothetical protein [Ilumatobacteraceae bacterium]
MLLSIAEGRVLGCLLEKERTVPDQYPLTANTLVSACNQSTARDPLMHLAEHDVISALTTLKSDGMLRFVHPSHGRSVTRYRQVADEKLGLDKAEAAVVALLLLRGPQTAAELQARSGRMHDFASTTAVDVTLRTLAERDLVELMERQPGQKEQRWRQLLAEQAEITHIASAGGTSSGGMADRVAELEARVARLEAALADLL